LHPSERSVRQSRNEKRCPPWERPPRWNSSRNSPPRFCTSRSTRTSGYSRGWAFRPNELHGVFAVRSPARPNPIGLTLGQVTRIEGTRIEFDRLDFVDGTAVVDIKPYFASREMIFSARNDAVGKPLTREAMRESLLTQAVRFAGNLSTDVALAVRVLEHFRTEELDRGEPQAWQIAAPLVRPQMLDAFTGMTRVTLGRGNLRLAEAHNIVELQGQTQYKLHPFPGGVDDIWSAPDAALFTTLRLV
jgi:tRNA-methyltransferase O